MTNNKLTKEWLQQTIAELESVRDEIPFGIDTNSELELAAFKLALAAMDSEPVAYSDERNLGYIDRGRETAYLWGKQNSEASDVALYRHAQQPVVESEPVALQPELAKVIYHFRDWNEGFPVERFKADYVISWMLANYPPAQPAPVVPDERPSLNNGIVGFDEGWNACRAAMLQAEPVTTANKLGNSPVIQDTWIPVSEQMPENDESKPIAIFTGKCLGQGIFVATYDDNGFFDFWEGMEIIGVTHWMPLPAAPQEVK